ncbi:hypothetical protein [Streptomyces sp. NPDC059909]|uniref:hypothetical protein n=1 Tax=Streptomyces sp. NPDC059909 TaxID=3346998 RepID=UPI003661651C
METEVVIRRAEGTGDGSAGGSYVLVLPDDQFHLLRRAAVVFAAQEQSPAARALVLGSWDVSLDAPLQLALPYDDVVPGPVTLTFAQLHALHAILTTLPTSSVWTEEEFVGRVGDFRETLLRLASGLRWGIAVRTGEAGG